MDFHHIMMLIHHKLYDSYKLYYCLVREHSGLIPDICHGHKDGVRGEKICHVEKFQISVMRRNLKFLHMWINFTFHHMTDVEKSEISFIMCTIYGILLHFTLFWCRICLFLRFALFCRKIGLLRFTRYCVEKILAKNSARGAVVKHFEYIERKSLVLDHFSNHST